MKIGINLVNTDLIRVRAFGPAVHGFLGTIREGQPDVPLFVISPVLCPIHEDTPGPDGLDLYGPADAHGRPLPDGLHPDTATHRLVGERFAAQVLAGSGC